MWGEWGFGKEMVRRWVVQARIGGGQCQGATSEELAEIKGLKAEVCRLEEDHEIFRRAWICFVGGGRPRQPLIVAFIDELRAAGHAVESICRVLREQGLSDRRADLPGLDAGQPPRSQPYRSTSPRSPTR